MTVTSDDRRVLVTATSGQLTYTYDFKIYNSSEITVKRSSATGQLRTLTEGTTKDYTVTGAGTTGGTIVLSTHGTTDSSQITTSDRFSIQGKSGLGRASDYATGGDFLASDVNTEEDRQHFLIQELRRDIDRSVVIQEQVNTPSISVTLPENEDGKVIGWSGTTLANLSLSTGAVSLSDAAPSAIGTAAAGTGTNVSRFDHVHAISTSLDVVNIDVSSAMTVGSSLTVTGPIVSSGSWLDRHGNEVVKFIDGSTISVNEFSITNSSAGTGPIISASGGDTNIDIRYQTKGDGVHEFDGAVAASSAITVTPGSTGQIAIDFADGNIFTVTQTTANTAYIVSAPTNQQEGMAGSIFLQTSTAGANTISFNAVWKFAGGTAPTQSTNIAVVDRVDYLTRGTTAIHAVYSKNIS